ncbi:lytic transglycosylase domain-containing protein [uncultured Gelidibacter sp.]|uniref:lytic transglycosylase domain-containing protein n=1 Tax=uncultured Gelidibacter sp. TaxID=259318 RepID=UPI0026156044|nr:lytic transglycosylase domain-containing protein [uncultured Gelidibacter sp.]
MNQKIVSLTFGALCVCGLSFSQGKTPKKDAAKAPNKTVSVQIDSISDGEHGAVKEIKPVADSLKSKKIEDLKIASEIDQKWLDELYGNELFDSIYQSVTDLKYDAIDYPELPTDTLKVRLKKLSARTPFNIEYNASLESVIKSYLKHRRHSMERLMALSEYYFPLFEKELDNYNVPLEIKYLAIVESALKPRAKSRVGATGLWQFMYGTGKMYGLNVTSYVDDRSDPIKSTEAASKYLAKLYEIFGDWDLALAAYNSGPGNVSKAIRRSGGYENYWNIRPHLPRETAGYLPAFLATMYIFEYAEEHGFKKHKPNFRYMETDTIHVKQTISLDQVSELLELPMEELQFLNPSYKLDVIPFVEGENYTLRLPKHAVGKFVNNEASIYEYVTNELNKREKPVVQILESKSKSTYTVRSGDNLGKIARQYGVRVSDLKAWNGLRSNNLKIGQRLSVYNSKASISAKPVSAVASNSSAKSSSSGSAKTYKVKSGDSLWSISRKFPGVSIQNIKDWNDISGTNLKVGTTLKVSR